MKELTAHLVQSGYQVRYTSHIIIINLIYLFNKIR